MRAVFLSLLLAGYGSFGQTTQDTSGQHKAVVVVAAGKQFNASAWKKFWWGKHWRNEWIQEVQFPVFDISTVNGGFTILKEGGGHETKSLRLKSTDGKEYVLRTVNKSLEVITPEKFHGSFVDDIIEDQICTAHPYGPLVVAKLSDVVGMLHTNPTMVFVPDDPLLGEFRKDFGNKICLFEERPSGSGWQHSALTNDADIIVNSDKLFERLDADPSQSVDQRFFLTARLMDMLINDWDRHEDQWVWAGKNINGKMIYTAFARDRDQSFSKTDGVSMYFLSRPWAYRSLQNMDKRLKDVIGSNLSATGLDRQFTNALTKSDWQTIIREFQSKLTDTDIRKAVEVLPPEIYRLSGDFLYKRLIDRRNNMMSSAMKYYEILNKEVTVKSTNAEECLIIGDAASNTISVTTLLMKNGEITKDTLFHRTFKYPETKIINLYALNGNDIFRDERKFRDRILIRAFGGLGQDIFMDSMKSSNRTLVYDSKENQPAAAPNFHYRISDTATTAYRPKAFKYDWSMPLIAPGYNPDDGFVLTAGITYKKMRWNKTPYNWQQTFLVKYAASTKALDLRYHGIFKKTFGMWDLDMIAEYKAPAYFVSFYGYGNDTKSYHEGKSFYRVRARSTLIDPGISRSWKRHYIKADLLFEAVKVEKENNKFIGGTTTGIDSSVFSSKYFGGAGITYNFNSTDDKEFPAKGILLNTRAKYFVNLKESRKNSLQLSASYSFYHRLSKNIIFAHRSGAATNSGKFEFYQANSIGGTDNLRGYWRSRYTGKTSLFQNTDLRWKITELKGYVFRGAFGIYGLFDAGRVWVKNEHSKKLHTGYGGGIFYIPYQTMAINIFYASSAETNTFTIRTGFFF